jgi:LmbE family N-acetylglucosaminyl deacetylase
VNRTPTLVFVVAHPDDEAIWSGGILYELSRLGRHRCYVVCLSGGDPGSPRAGEFARAREVAGYAKGVVLGGALRKALDPLPSIAELVESALRDQFNLSTQEVDLIVTHSPHGDEMQHPHHQQAYRELHAWTKKRKIPFGFFSTSLIPFFLHQPLALKPIRDGSFQILQFSRLRSSVHPLRRLLDHYMRRMFHLPRYHLLFWTDPAMKRKMIECYVSIGLEEHLKDYSASSHSCEGLYLRDEEALIPFESLLQHGSLARNPNLFEFASYRHRIPDAIRRILARFSSDNE